jgi:hypothetical protein
MALGSMTGRAAKPRVSAGDRRKLEEDDLYEMANLFPRTTGLPMTVWVSPRGRARHDARVRVSLTPGKMDIGHTPVVGTLPSPKLIEGNLASVDVELVAQWISANEEALIDFWNEIIDSVELGARLRKI